jgi:hypothetical protein
MLSHTRIGSSLLLTPVIHVLIVSGTVVPCGPRGAGSSRPASGRGLRRQTEDVLRGLFLPFGDLTVLRSADLQRRIRTIKIKAHVA